MKYRYQITVNHDADGTDYSFRYGHTYNICLRVSEQSASISALMRKNYGPDISGTYALSLIREGVKRAALIHLLKSQKSEPLRIDNVTVTIYKGEQQESSQDISEMVRLYQMIGQTLHLSLYWKREDVLICAASGMKSDEWDKPRRASLYAFLYSKSKNFAVERFSYLWMSLNGLYSHVYACKGITTRGRAKETDKIESMMQKYGLGNRVPYQKVNDTIGDSVQRIINQYIDRINGEHTTIDRNTLLNGRHQHLAKQITAVLQTNLEDFSNSGLNAWSYLITGFAYYLRCHLLHAGEPLPLFAFAEDWEIRVLQVVNGLLDEFLDSNLWREFSSHEA